MTSPAAAQNDQGAFTDDDGTRLEVAMDALDQRGVLAGTQCAPGRICPDATISRSVMAVWLGRAVARGEPPETRSNRFADIDPDDWRAPHIERLAKIGITAGCASDPLRYCPDDRVTRGQMAALLMRAFDLPEAEPAGFADTAGHFFEDQVDALTAADFTAGCATGPLRYCPDDRVTRGQMVVVIARALGVAAEPVIRNDEKVLEPVARLTGGLAPKSVVASGTGLYFAQNMMYLHTVSVFDATKNLVATLDNSVDLAAFGYDVPGEVYRGAPVEAAFTSDGSYAFVSNYRMYGPGYNPRAGGDACAKDEGQRSFVYRIDTAAVEIDRVYEAGPVPKFLAVTPDDRLLLVSNWCGFDVSVIDLRTHETLAEIEVGRHPRGIAVSGDGSTAYVAVMGSTDIAVIDLAAVSSDMWQGPGSGQAPTPRFLRDVGRQPRHLVLSPDDSVLFATLNGEGGVVALDADTGDEYPWLMEVWNYTNRPDFTYEFRGTSPGAGITGYDWAPAVAGEPIRRIKATTISAGKKTLDYDFFWPGLVHELAHVYTRATDGVSNYLGSVGVAALYFERLADRACQDNRLGAELYADAAQKFVDLSVEDPTWVDYHYWNCQYLPTEPTEEALEVIRNAFSGEMPQWLYDTFQLSNGKLDYKAVWAEVKAASPQARARVIYQLKDEFGGYCSNQAAYLSAFGNSDLKQPWRDGGCS